MRAWFDSLEARERLMVAAGAALLVLFLLYVLVWSPIHSGYDALRNSVEEQRTTALWMRESAQTLTSLKRNSGKAAQGLGGKSLLSVADSTARAGGLGTALKRVEPEGKDSVRVWLDGAPFDVLVKWLGTLSIIHGVSAESATLERSDATGRVNARLTLQATI
ncbi:MAG: type II secretion system protein M [Gammaproteobacteria bacterium]